MGKISKIRQISRALQGKRSERSRAIEQGRAASLARENREDVQAHDREMQARGNETRRQTEKARQSEPARQVDARRQSETARQFDTPRLVSPRRERRQQSRRS